MDASEKKYVEKRLLKMFLTEDEVLIKMSVQYNTIQIKFILRQES